MTGVNESAWKRRPVPPLVPLAVPPPEPPEETVCASGAFWRAVHAQESATNISAFHSDCRISVRNLKFGGAMFGPPSEWEIFQRLCRSCSRHAVYKRALNGRAAVGGAREGSGGAAWRVVNAQRGARLASRVQGRRRCGSHECFCDVVHPQIHQGAGVAAAAGGL